MKNKWLDYVLCECLLSLIAAPSASIVWVARGPLKTCLQDFSSVGFIVLFLLLYGAGTAIALALLGQVMPLREGEYATDAAQFTLWKVRHVVEELGKSSLYLFFPVFFRQCFYALFGARIGTGVAVSGKILDPSLVTLEDGCVLGEGVIVTSHVMAQNRFILRRVHIGKGATVGMGCVLLPGARIGAGAVVLPGSVVRLNTVIPSGETWGGVPAVPMK